LTKEKGTIEHLWSIRQSAISKELRLTAPPADIHRFKYDHQLLIGDCFTLLHEEAEDWGQKKLTRGLIPDRQFEMGKRYYLEAEMGNHKTDELISKIDRYKKYRDRTKEDFTVLFLMAFDKDLPIAERALRGQPTAYETVSFNQLKTSINSSYTVSYTISQRGEQIRLLN
jgi:hypothetical protein